MDVYEQYSTPPPPLECLRIDDLLDFSNNDLFSSSSTSTAAVHHHLPPPPPAFSSESRPSIYYNCHSSSTSFSLAAAPSTDFTDNLSVPSDDVAELEWLSQFVDDSFAEFPAHPLSGANNLSADTSLSSRARSKRSRGKVTDTASWILAPTEEFESPAAAGKPRTKKETRAAPSPTEEGGVRRCTHCASEKTPQWRTGPLGPKTLCNACGVRYKSGRLVPEYRPAASPTFVLTQHSNSHRKVMELRRKKEMLRQNQRPQEVLSDDHQQHNIYHHQDFEVC